MESLKNLKKFWSKKKVFITGHTGFKGTWLCIILKFLNSKVYGYSLYPKNKSLFNQTKIKSMIDSNTYGDISDIKRLRKKVQLLKPEIIIHLAAQPLVIESYKKPLQTFQTNIIGTYTMLEATRAWTKIPTFCSKSDDRRTCPGCTVPANRLPSSR